MKREHKIALILFGCAVLFRLLFAIPGMQNPELLMRPDSATYLAPAQALLEYGHYGHGSFPTALRVPLYPVLLAPWLWLDGGSAGFFCILIKETELNDWLIHCLQRQIAVLMNEL